MNLRSHGFGLLAIVAVVAISSPVRAGMDSYSVTSSVVDTPTNFSKALSIPAFNTSLGTLESVVISYTDHVDIVGSVTNTSASAQTFTLADNVSFNLDYNGASILNNSLLATNTYSSLMPNVKTAFGAFHKDGASDQLTYSFLDSNFADFQGPNPLSFLLIANAATSLTGNGGNSSDSIKTTSHAGLTVTYNYIGVNVVPAVPEPASLAMCVIGGLSVALGVARSRKVARRAAC